MDVTVSQSLIFDPAAAVQLVLLGATAVAAVWAAYKGSQAASAATRQARASEGSVSPSLSIRRADSGSGLWRVTVTNGGPGRALNVRARLRLEAAGEVSEALLEWNVLKPDESLTFDVFEPREDHTIIIGADDTEVGRYASVISATLYDDSAISDHALIEVADESLVAFPIEAQTRLYVDGLTTLGTRTEPAVEVWGRSLDWDRHLPIQPRQ